MAQANEQQHQPTSACPCTHAHAQVLPRRSIGYDEQFSSQCIVRTRATRSSTKFAHAAWPSPSSGHHAETRHPGTADAAQRQARVGLRERTGQNPLAEHAHHAPQPRSIAWGEVQEKQRHTLLVRVFWKGSGNGSSDVVISPPEAGGCCPRLAAEVRAETPLKLAAQVLRQEAEGR